MVMILKEYARRDTSFREYPQIFSREATSTYHIVRPSVCSPICRGIVSYLSGAYRSPEHLFIKQLFWPGKNVAFLEM